MTMIIARQILFVIIGGIAGYVVYKFVGCHSGTCPITSNPYMSIGYGALFGFLFGR